MTASVSTDRGTLLLSRRDVRDLLDMDACFPSTRRDAGCRRSRG